MLGTFEPKPKPCAQCGSTFLPFKPMQNVCGPMCAKRWVMASRKRERAQTRERRKALETIPELIKAAQVAFNAYIRARDAKKPCICCDKPLGDGDVGGAYDCGHYRSTGSAPHLRFDERNAAGQRKVCNRWGAGRAVDYRIGLIRRIGVEMVEALEADNRVHKWTADELRAIRATYKQKLKDLLKEQA
jgi:hypothetical protein